MSLDDGDGDALVDEVAVLEPKKREKILGKMVGSVFSQQWRDGCRLVET